MASVMFTVPGKPQGKARARTYYNASTKKHCSTTPENTVLYASYGLIVNAWMPLPKPYKEND